MNYNGDFYQDLPSAKLPAVYVYKGIGSGLTTKHPTLFSFFSFDESISTLHKHEEVYKENMR